MRIPRKRFIQLCVRSTTQRRALRRAVRLIRWASSPLAGMCAVKPNSWTVARTSSYALAFFGNQRSRGRYAVQRLFAHVHVRAVAPAAGRPDRHAGALDQGVGFGALFGGVVGFFA